MKSIEDCQESGREEVRRCRENSGRREASSLGEVTIGRCWWFWLGRMAWQNPHLVAVILLLPGYAAGILKQFKLLRKQATAVLEFRERLLFLSGAVAEAGGWEKFRREFAIRLPVLCYHHVGTKLSGSWPILTVSTGVFTRQIRWLAEQGYTGIHANDWLDWVHFGKLLPEKPILITFDDGYSDLLQNAFPVLKANNYKSTMFVVSQYIGGPGNWPSPLGYTGRPLMTAEQILELARDGVEIGAHSRTHRDLRNLLPDELKAELTLCREELSTLVSTPVNTLAYPFGYHNASVRDCAGKIYDIAFSSTPGLNVWRSDRSQLRRMFVHRSRVNFFLQVKFGLDLCAAFRFLKSRAGRWIASIFSPGVPKPAQHSPLSTWNLKQPSSGLPQGGVPDSH